MKKIDKQKAWKIDDWKPGTEIYVTAEVSERKPFKIQQSANKFIIEIQGGI